MDQYRHAHAMLLDVGKDGGLFVTIGQRKG